jgi:hypothetical protein
MQEAFSYATNWDSWSPDGFYYPYSGEAEHPLTFNNNGFQEDILALTGISGMVTNSQTVSGNFLLAGDLTINANIVLGIDPGSQFTLSGGSKIHSFGILNAEGESGNEIVFNSQSSSNAHIVRFYNSTSSASSLQYCQLQNAVRGIYNDESSPTIENCEITNCSYGIYNNYASPTIKYADALDVIFADAGRNSSIGFCQVKIKTAYWIEKQLNDSTSKFFPGKEYSNLLTVSDAAAELMRKLVNDSLNILYAAGYLRIIQAYWEKAGFQINGRPDILGTLYSTGMFRPNGEIRRPNGNPKANEFGKLVIRYLNLF